MDISTAIKDVFNDTWADIKAGFFNAPATMGVSSSNNDPAVINESRLFMTEKTRVALPETVITGISKTIPDDLRVVLVGPDDFNKKSFSYGQTTHYDNQPTAAFSTVFNQAGMRTQALFVRNSEFTSLAGISPAAVGANSLQRKMEEIGKATAAFSNKSCFITLSMEGQNNKDVSNMVKTAFGDIDQPAGFGELMLIAGAGALAQEKIPGVSTDIQMFIAHHELGHCGNEGEDFDEYKSDRWAAAQYAVDMREGRAIDPEIPYYVRSIRAAATVLGRDGDEYRLNGLSPLPGEQGLHDSELAGAKQEINAGLERLYGALAEKNDLSRKRVEEMIADPEYRQIQAQLVYEQALYMIKAGAFDDLPHARTVMERFVEGAQRYGHGYFNVAPEDYIITAPDLPLEARGLENHLHMERKLMPVMNFGASTSY